MYSQSNNLRKARAVVTITDALGGIADNASVTSSAQSFFSNAGRVLGQVHNDIGVATFEPNFWRLDGSFVLGLASGEGSANGGFVSQWISRGSLLNNSFDPVPEMNINFPTNRDIPRISIIFCNVTGEVLDSLRVRFFNVNGAVILDETITGNRASMVQTAGGANNVRRILINFLRSANPYRRVRIAGIVLGGALHYDGEDIKALNVTAEADPLGRAMPKRGLGLTIFNKGRYSLLDDNSHARHLRRRQRVECSIGVDNMVLGDRLRWTRVGRYYLDSWDIDHQLVNINALGAGARLFEGVYRHSSFLPFNLGFQARHVAADAGFEVVVPDVMNTSPPIPRYFGNVSHKEALCMIAEIASCLLFEDGNGVLHFVDPLASPDISDTIDYEKMLYEPRVGLGTFYNGVLMTETFLNLQPNYSVQAQVDVQGQAHIVVPFERPIFNGHSVIVPPGFVLNNTNFQPYFMEGTISGNGSAQLIISGNRASISSYRVFYPGADYVAGDERMPYVLDTTMLLRNFPLAHLNTMRNWVIGRKLSLINMRLNASANWRQNPMLEPGMRVSMQGDRAGRMMTGHVVKQRIDFDDGVLRGLTKIVSR